MGERDEIGKFPPGHSKVGDYIPTVKPTGNAHGLWKGDDASYAAKHMWVGKHFGKAERCEIDPSHTGRFEWSNISGKYLRQRSDWRQLCASCHRIVDYGDICKRGHALTIGNTYKSKHSQARTCLTCHREDQREYMKRRREASNVN
jgi:hypothetical protein